MNVGIKIQKQLGAFRKVSPCLRFIMTYRTKYEITARQSRKVTQTPLFHATVKNTRAFFLTRLRELTFCIPRTPGRGRGREKLSSSQSSQFFSKEIKSRLLDDFRILPAELLPTSYDLRFRDEEDKWPKTKRRALKPNVKYIENTRVNISFYLAEHFKGGRLRELYRN